MGKTLTDGFLAAALERTGPLRLTEAELAAFSRRVIVLEQADPDSTDIRARLLPDDPREVARFYVARIKSWAGAPAPQGEYEAVMAGLGGCIAARPDVLDLLLGLTPPLPPGMAPSGPPKSGDGPAPVPTPTAALPGPVEAPAGDAVTVTQRG